MTGLAYALVTSDRTIVMMAPDGGRHDSVNRDAASRGYVEAWAFYLAQMLGNVTPENVGFIKARISPLLCPDIYGDAMAMLSNQVVTITRDRVALSFEPHGVLVEDATGKVFVDGQATDHPVMGTEERTERSFEFVIRISDYRVQVCGLQSYEGPPRTLQLLAQGKERDAQAKSGNGGGRP
jgi:conjugal transfer pilus assembly protein TraE